MRTRLAIGAPLLRLRSDEQLVALFRSGNTEAFRVIHDRYRQRLFAYTRQMLPGSRQDAEDALQDVFVRAYNGLRANDRELALRAWLYRVAHNRCIDELRRPPPPAREVLELVRPPLIDPIEEAEQRESLQRLIADLRRLPEQQRSALLMRELGGMSYAELAAALGVSVPAIKSLLVRARVGLAQAAEARATSCVEIREELIVTHDRGVRATGMARRHMRDCPGCREFRGQLRGTSKQFAALLPALGPAGVLAKLLGLSGGAGGSAAAGSSAAASGGAVAAGGILGAGGTVASVGVLASGAGHVATLLAAAVVTAGGAVEIQHSITPAHHNHHRAVAAAKHMPMPSPAPVTATYAAPVVATAEPAATVAPAPAPSPPPPARPRHHRASRTGAWLPPKPMPDLATPYGTTPGDATGAAGATPPGSTATGKTGASTPPSGDSAGTGMTTGAGTSASTGAGSSAAGSSSTGSSTGFVSTTSSGGAAGSGSGSGGATQTGTNGTQGSGTGTSAAQSGSGGSATGSGAASTGSGGSTTTG